MASKITVFVAQSEWAGDLILGHRVDGDPIEVEIVSLDTAIEPPVYWEAQTEAEAQEIVAYFEEYLEMIQSIDHPFAENEIDIEYLIDDVLFEINEAKEILAAFQFGEAPDDDTLELLDTTVAEAEDAVLVAAEPISEVDPLPSNVQDSIDEFLDDEQEWIDLD